MVKSLRRVLTVALSSILLLSMMMGCGQTSGNNTSPSSAQSAATSSAEQEWQKETAGSGGIKLPIVKETVEYTFMFPEHPTWPFKDTYIVLPELEKRTNVKIKIQPVPYTGYEQKYSVVLASGNLPDMIGQMTAAQADELGPKLFLNVWDYLNVMPNFKEKVDNVPEVSQYKYSKNEMYLLPTTYRGKMLPNYTTHIRTDILDKLNLKVPTTTDELFNVLKELRKAYPNVYPWVIRSNNTGLTPIWNTLSASWGVPVNLDLNKFFSFDNQTGTWKFGPAENGFRKMVEFVSECYKNELLDKECILTNTTQWEEKLLQDKGFFTTDWYQRSIMMTNKAKGTNPSYVLTAIMPPKPDVDGGASVTLGSPAFNNGTVISKNVKNPEILMKLLDYMYYSLDGTILMSCGVEGVTYTIKDKAIDFIPQPDFDVQSSDKFHEKYGTGVDNFVGFEVGYWGYRSPSDIPGSDLYKQDSIFKDNKVAAAPVIVFNSDERDIIKESGSPLFDFVNSELTRFALGQRPMSEYDSFLADAKKYGSDTVLKAYNDAQARANAAK